MEESKTQSNSHIPLVTRLDHLDFVMKSLEGKQDLSKWGAKTYEERQPISLDLAAREAYFKGSLMDRVALLERRLFQLCLEMESSSRSSGSQSSGFTASNSTQGGSKSSTNPNYAHHFQDFLAPNYNPQLIKEKTNKEEGRKDPKAMEQKSGKNNNEKGEEKTSKSGRKKTTAKWPHIKILGC